MDSSLVERIDVSDNYQVELDSGETTVFTYNARVRLLVLQHKPMDKRLHIRTDRKDLSLFTYKISSLPQVEDLNREEIEELVTNSWMKWRTVGNILVRKRDNSSTPNIEIIAAYPNPECNCFPETVVGPPTFTNIKIYVDAKVRWTKNDFKKKLTHELGHALGLRDSTNHLTSVMSNQMLVGDLSKDDRTNIINIYGPAPTPATDNTTDEEIREVIEEELIRLGILDPDNKD